MLVRQTAMPPDWNAYNRWNQRHRGMSELWVRELVAWLVAENVAGAHSNVLDYGCSWFDVGAALAARVRRVDGFDIDPAAVAAARQRMAGCSHVTLFDAVAQIPMRTYDVIVVNSVLQYMRDEAEVATFLRQARDWLVSARATIVVSDVIPPQYSPARDAVDSLAVALRHGLLWPMLTHLRKAARMPAGHGRLRLAPETMTRLALSAGFACELLDRNLTPSKRRFTCRLRPS